MHAQSSPGNLQPLPHLSLSLTSSFCQEKMSKLRKHRWNMWRGVVSHSRDIVEQSFSSSPAKPFATESFAGDSDRPQEERMETLSRVQKYFCVALFLNIE